MNFKVSDDPLFQDKWQHLMHTNERFLSALHESTDNSINIGNAVTALRVSINRLMELIPVKATVNLHDSRYKAFADIGADLRVSVKSGNITDGWVKVELFAPRHRIVELANQFKIGVKWEQMSWTYL